MKVLEWVELHPLAGKLHPLHRDRQTVCEQTKQEAFKSVYPLQWATSAFRLHQQTSHNWVLLHDWTIGSWPFTSLWHSGGGLRIQLEILNSFGWWSSANPDDQKCTNPMFSLSIRIIVECKWTCRLLLFSEQWLSEWKRKTSLTVSCKDFERK